MKLIAMFVWSAFLGVLVPAGAVYGAPLTYVYTVEHPFYGNVGTYTDVIDDAGGVLRIDSTLHIAVTLLGIALYQEDATRSEVWRGSRLSSFVSVTDRNGSRIRVTGAAGENVFFVTSSSGTVSAPADIAPSDPWALKRIGTGAVVSTRSGKIDKVEVIGGEAASLFMNGIFVPVRHFRVRTEAQLDKWEIWFDEHGVPIKFRSLESGTPIDFIIASQPSPQAGGAPGGLGLTGSPTIQTVH